MSQGMCLQRAHRVEPTLQDGVCSIYEHNLSKVRIHKGYIKKKKKALKLYCQ
jgi:hypothetical protein